MVVTVMMGVVIGVVGVGGGDCGGGSVRMASTDTILKIT